MKDVELAALIALVNSEIEEVRAANAQRQHLGQSMAYDGVSYSPAIKGLEAELKKRGVLA